MHQDNEWCHSLLRLLPFCVLCIRTISRVTLFLGLGLGCHSTFGHFAKGLQLLVTSSWRRHTLVSSVWAATSVWALQSKSCMREVDDVLHMLPLCETSRTAHGVQSVRANILTGAQTGDDVERRQCEKAENSFGRLTYWLGHTWCEWK